MSKAEARRWSLGCLPVSVWLAMAVLVALPCCATVGSGGGESALTSVGEADDQGWEEEEEDEQDPGRSFLYKELVFSGLYSPGGVVGIPLNDRTRDHFEFSPRPPGNYFGLEFIQTLTSSSSINRDILPDWLPLTAIDLHPRLVFERQEEDGSLDRIKFAPQDFWARFNPGGVDRLSLRIGQFVLPYGVNPILAPRQKFILPLESTDLGLKWDWGLDVKGPLGEYDWEIATTIGSGEGLHSPHLFRDSDRTSFLVTGRVGTPTYWDLQYGLSFLYGDLPTIRGAKIFGDIAISRWRVGLDGQYRQGTFLTFGAQATFGQDGFAGDEEFVAVSGGKTADVLGYRGWLDWVLPFEQDLRVALQFESVIRDLATSGSDDSAVIFELRYSLTTSLSLVLDYRHEFNRASGGEGDAVFLTLVFYGK